MACFRLLLRASWFLLLLELAFGSHFGGGEIRWRQLSPLNGTNYKNTKWELSYRLSWRRTHSGSRSCTTKAIENGLLLTTNNVLYCNGCQALKSTKASYHCTDSSVALDMVTGGRTLHVTANRNDSLRAWFGGCCWRKLANGASKWMVWAKVDLSALADAKRQTNASPKSAIPLLIPVTQNCTQSIDLRVTDSDKDLVRCRWAKGTAECAGLCKHPVGVQLDGDRCRLLINRPNTTGLHGIAIVMEDYASPNAKKPLSQASLQFLIRVLPKRVLCHQRPLFIASTPLDGSVIHVPVNTTWSQSIDMLAMDKSNGIRELITRSPSGLSKSTLSRSRVNPIHYRQNVSWTPGSKDRGKHSFCFIAITLRSTPSEMRCITLTTEDLKVNPTLETTQTSGGDFTATPTPIQRQVFCVADVSGQSSSRGALSWLPTLAGTQATVPCPFATKNEMAYRSCADKGVSVGVWGPVQNQGCPYGKKTTMELDDLSKKPLDSNNVNNITKTVTQISDDTKSITEEEAALISDLVEKIVATNSVDDEVSNLLLRTTSNIMNGNKSMLVDTQASSGSLSKLVTNIAKMAQNLPLPNITGKPVTKFAADVALQAVKFDRRSFQGTHFVVKNVSLSGKSFGKNDLDLGNTVKGEENVDVMVSLPQTLLTDVSSGGSSGSRVSFVVYRDASLFRTVRTASTGLHQEAEDVQIVTMVVAIETERENAVPLSRPVTLLFRSNKNLQRKNPKCGFWNFTANSGLGEWSSQGCTIVSLERDQVTCSCNHLTNFAVLFDPHAATSFTPHSTTHAKVLSAITYVGIGLSLLGLFFTLLTFALFKQLREGTHAQITLNLCIALTLTLILFVSTIDLSDGGKGCQIAAVFLHYFLLATFMWMLIQGIDLYLKFVKVLGSYIKSLLFRSVFFAWGFPIILVAISAGVRWDDYGHPTACIVTSYAAYGFLFVPILLVILCNLIVFFFVLKSLGFRQVPNKSQKDDNFLLQFKFAIMCCFLLGLTWLFGAFAVGDSRLTFQYLFCLFNALQGFFIFYFQVASKKKVQILWLGFLTGKGRRRSPSSLYSSQAYTLRSKSRKSDASTTSAISQIPPGKKESSDSNSNTTDPNLSRRESHS